MASSTWHWQSKLDQIREVLNSAENKPADVCSKLKNSDKMQSDIRRDDASVSSGGSSHTMIPNKPKESASVQIERPSQRNAEQNGDQSFSETDESVTSTLISNIFTAIANQRPSGLRQKRDKKERVIDCLNYSDYAGGSADRQTYTYDTNEKPSSDQNTLSPLTSHLKISTHSIGDEAMLETIMKSPYSQPNTAGKCSLIECNNAKYVNTTEPHLMAGKKLSEDFLNSIPFLELTKSNVIRIIDGHIELTKERAAATLKIMDSPNRFKEAHELEKQRARMECIQNIRKEMDILVKLDKIE